jgi:filamentous hemagglutinin family protein
MNHIYRLIWSQVLSAWVAVAETGRGRGKGESRKLKRMAAAVLLACTGLVQPSASAIAVNRILDTNGTQILGRLNANGQVYLINPNGILFGQGAQVNVGGLVASTLDLNDASLSGNTRIFSGNGNGTGTGSIVNQGTINAVGSALSNEVWA